MPAPVSPRQLLDFVLADDIDAALDAGLMDYLPQPGDDALEPNLPQLLQDAQQRLRDAWAARERHRARALRLARIAGKRDARRIRPAPAAATVTALPAAAVAALARARAKAATRTDD